MIVKNNSQCSFSPTLTFTAKAESDDDAAMAGAEDVGPGKKGGRAGGSLRSEGDVKGTHFVHNKRGVGALVWPHRCPSVCLC